MVFDQENDRDYIIVLPLLLPYIIYTKENTAFEMAF